MKRAPALARPEGSGASQEVGHVNLHQGACQSKHSFCLFWLPFCTSKYLHCIKLSDSGVKETPVRRPSRRLSP
jgi:hypothetical protein